MKTLTSFIIFISLFSIAFGDDFIIDEPGGASSNVSSSPPPKNTSNPPVVSGNSLFSIGSVPIPTGLGRGNFFGQFLMYDNGGVNAKFVVGVWDAIDIGISENLDGLIGSGNVNVNIPGAYLKVTLLKDLDNFNWAIGFDNFIYGSEGTYFPTNTNEAPSTIYGFYTAAGWHYSLIGGNDVLSVGLRFPLLPDEERNVTNMSIFAGATISAPQYISVGFTIENFFFDVNRMEYILPSLIFNFNPTPPFNISLMLQYDFSVSKLIRIFSLSYEAGF